MALAQVHLPPCLGLPAHSAGSSKIHALEVAAHHRFGVSVSAKRAAGRDLKRAACDFQGFREGKGLSCIVQPMPATAARCPSAEHVQQSADANDREIAIRRLPCNKLGILLTFI